VTTIIRNSPEACDEVHLIPPAACRRGTDADRAELRIGSIEGIPLVQRGCGGRPKGVPGRVTELKNQIIARQWRAAGYPEYNNSIPGVMKNAVDWLSRPRADLKTVFGRQAIRHYGSQPWRIWHHPEPERLAARVANAGNESPGSARALMVSRAQTGISMNRAKLKDDAVKEQLEEFLKGFVSFVSAK
jgi:hypothetical protein